MCLPCSSSVYSAPGTDLVALKLISKAGKGAAGLHTKEGRGVPASAQDELPVPYVTGELNRTTLCVTTGKMPQNILIWCLVVSGY